MSPFKLFREKNHSDFSCFNGISFIYCRKMKTVLQVRFVGNKLLSSACFPFILEILKYFLLPPCFKMIILFFQCSPPMFLTRSPSLEACNYPIFLPRRFHRPIYFWFEFVSSSDPHKNLTPGSYVAFLPCRMQFASLSFVWIAFDFRNATYEPGLSAQLESQAQTNVYMSTCSLEAALFYPYRSVLV